MPSAEVPWDLALRIAARKIDVIRAEEWRAALGEFLKALQANENRPTPPPDIYHHFGYFNAALRSRKSSALLLVTGPHGARSFCHREGRRQRVRFRAEPEVIPWERMLDAVSPNMDDERETLERLRDNRNSLVVLPGPYFYSTVNQRFQMFGIAFRIMCPTGEDPDWVCVCHDEITSWEMAKSGAPMPA
jgi:hypothetical protein